LRDDNDIGRSRIAILEPALSRLKLDAQRAQDDLRQAEADTRRAQDAVGSASDPEDRARAVWRLELARVKTQAAAATASVASVLTQFRTDDLAARQAELRLLERQINLASRNMTFTEADVATARQRLDEQLVAVRRELVEVEAEEDTRLQQRDAAKQALDRVQQGATAAELATAEARLEAAEAWVETLRDQSDALQGLIVLSGQSAATWGNRYALVHNTNPESRRIAAAKLRAAAQRTNGWKAYTETLTREARTKLDDIESGTHGRQGQPARVALPAGHAGGAAQGIAREGTVAEYARRHGAPTRPLGERRKHPTGTT
jgi:hypothetical protein